MATGTGLAPETTAIHDTEEELQAVPLPLDEEIRRRAHEIWLERGCPAGSDMEHWLAAEEEIRGAIAS